MSRFQLGPLYLYPFHLCKHASSQISLSDLCLHHSCIRTLHSKYVIVFFKKSNDLQKQKETVNVAIRIYLLPWLLFKKSVNFGELHQSTCTVGEKPLPHRPNRNIYAARHVCRTKNLCWKKGKLAWLPLQLKKVKAWPTIRVHSILQLMNKMNKLNLISGLQ